MSMISIRLSDNEHALFKDYAKLNNMNLSDLIKNSIFEKIYNDFDSRVFEEYNIQKENGTLKTKPIEELWKELQL